MRKLYVSVCVVLFGVVALVPATVSAYSSSNYYENYIINRESSGRPWVINPYSGACGLLQSWPCSKLANACPYWRTDIPCQLRYFYRDMQNRYGSWYRAYLHSRYYGWW